MSNSSSQKYDGRLIAFLVLGLTAAVLTVVLAMEVSQLNRSEEASPNQVRPTATVTVLRDPQPTKTVFITGRQLPGANRTPKNTDKRWATIGTALGGIGTLAAGLAAISAVWGRSIGKNRRLDRNT